MASNAQAPFEAKPMDRFRKTDLWFARLMGVQWVAGIVVALSKTRFGRESLTEIDVFAALLLGGLICTLPVFLAWRRADAKLTRYVIAVVQLLNSALLIHLAGGGFEA